MNLHLGADVRRRDGYKFGELQGIVIDPGADRVMALVVQRAGSDNEDILVTIRALDGVDPDGEFVYLNLFPDQFDRMRQRYVHAHNITGPPTADNMAVDLVEEPVNIPDVPPIGAATGIESIAFTPVIEAESNVRDSDVVIDRSTRVLAIDGDVGSVVRLSIDDATLGPTSLVAERGVIFTHDVELPFSEVRGYTVDGIELTVDSDTLRERGRQQEQ